ncbi:MAG: hypothetical protein ACOX9E_16065 [Lentisphaeria bacterium]
MKNIGRIAWMLVTALALSGTAAFAQLGLTQLDGGSGWRPQVDFTLDWVSRYIDNGEVLNPEPVGQAELCLALKGFYAGVWTCVDFTDVNDYHNEPEEWNYYLGYEYTFADVPGVESLTIDLGWTYFDCPRASSSDSQKLHLGAQLEDILLTPKVVVNWNYEDDIWWIEAGVSHDMPLEFISEKLLFGSSLALLWGNTRWNGGLAKDSDAYKNALASAVLVTDLKYQLTENVSFGPFVIAAWALDHDIREKFRADSFNNACNFVWGIELGMEF